MKTLINKRRSLCENRTILDIKYYGDMTGFMEIEICIQVLLLLRATRTRKKVVVRAHTHTQRKKMCTKKATAKEGSPKNLYKDEFRV